MAARSYSCPLSQCRALPRFAKTFSLQKISAFDQAPSSWASPLSPQGTLQNQEHHEVTEVAQKCPKIEANARLSLDRCAASFRHFRQGCSQDTGPCLQMPIIRRVDLVAKSSFSPWSLDRRQEVYNNYETAGINTLADALLYFLSLGSFICAASMGCMRAHLDFQMLHWSRRLLSALATLLWFSTLHRGHRDRVLQSSGTGLWWSPFSSHVVLRLCMRT